jgi:hypothetical protein
VIRAFALALILVAQTDVERGLQDLQRSHIEANVPAPSDFDHLLARDLGAYFTAARKQKSVPVQFELLRAGPTQSGVSYPKYYVWVRVAGGVTADDRGAVRVEAVDRTRFEVTDFISERAIQTDARRIHSVFPAPVCDRIEEKLHGPR